MNRKDLVRNPVLPPEHHIPDGEAHVMPDGKLYVYGSYDNQQDFYCSNIYRVASTADMKAWEVHDIALRAEDIPWYNKVIDGETVMRIDIYYRFIGKVGNENGEALKTQKMRWNTKALAPSA